MASIQERITALLQKEGPLGIAPITDKLGANVSKVHPALKGMKNKGQITVSGVRRKYLYGLPFTATPIDKGDLSKLKGTEKLIVETISRFKVSPLNAEEIAERLGFSLNNTRVKLNCLKKKGLIKTVGKRPWRYKLNVPEEESTQKEQESPDTTNSPLNRNYLMIFTNKGMGKVVVKGFNDPGEFASAFAAQQTDPNLVSIIGYKKLKCKTTLLPILTKKK